jgi:flavin reductase (DIM6/NTAB) family NADH-FMN oxidoreductase RutF
MSTLQRENESGPPARPSISLEAAVLGPTEMYVFLRDSIVPRPIAWVSTVNGEGVTNLAPFSFFNVVSPYPPVLGFSCGPRGDDHNAQTQLPKDTLINIRANGEFVVNLAPAHLMEPMMRSSDPLAHGESEFAHTGLTGVASTKVRPPRVAGVPVAFECRVYDILEVGVNAWIMGTVVQLHVDPAAYVGPRGDHKHRIDVLARTETRPVGRLDRANYMRIGEIETHLRKDGPG